MSIQDDLRNIADVLETDSHYSGTDESKRRAGHAATLRNLAAAMDAASPEAWRVRVPNETIAGAGASMREIGFRDGFNACRMEVILMNAAPPASEAWRPIETAPKDGRYVLAYVENTVQILSFDSTRGSSGGYWVRYPGDCLDLKPTHWRPMPALPANLTGAAHG